MTVTAHEDGSDKSVDGRSGVSLDQPQWVTVYDPLRGVPLVELKVRKSYATGKHICGELVRVCTSGLKGGQTFIEVS